MQRFWGTVIEPIFELVRPGVIVEIGSDRGGNTKNLLDYCRRSGAKLHVVDPAPGYDVQAWREEHGEYATFHEALSLDALPQIGDFDAVLIDGDHNWYTVFNELKLIGEHSQDFPLVMLHDVGWPYGRRDLYYDPETIPAKYRQPLERKGMLPGVRGLLEEGGMNRHLCNALREAEPKNGVLTAVEDFLSETDERLELVELPGLHGLGIIVSLRLKERNPALADLLRDLDFPPPVKRYIEGVERDRISKEIELQEERRRLRQERQKLREANRDLARLTQLATELDHGVTAMLQSRQWKVGSAVGRLYRALRRKPRELAGQSRLEESLGQLRAWREAWRRTNHPQPPEGEDGKRPQATL